MHDFFSNKAVSYLNKAIVFATPLFFIPWSASGVGIDAFGKYLFLWFIVPILIFLIGFSMFKKGEFRIRLSGLEVPILIFFTAVLISTFFSYDRISSWLGFSEKISDPLMGILILFFSFFLIFNYAKSKKAANELLNIFTYSYVFLVFSSLLLIVSYWLEIIPEKSYAFSFMRMAFGYIEDIAIYLSAANTFIFGILLSQELLSKKRLVKTAFFLSFVLLSIINFFTAWILLLFGMATVLVFRFLSRVSNDDESKKYTSLIIIPIIFILMYFVSTTTDTGANKQAGKLQLGYAASLDIAKKAIAAKPLFGYGPENFHYAFSLFRDNDMNDTPFWHIRFNEPASYLIDLAATTGLVGSLSYLLLLLWLVSVIRNHLKNKNTPENKNIILAICAGLIVLLGVQIFYSANIVHLFLFWFFAAICLSNISVENENEMDIKKKDDLSKFQITSSALAFLFLIWFVIMAYGVKYLAAESFYRQSKYSENSEKLLLRAIELHPYKYFYHITLSKYYREKALVELGRNKPAESEISINASIKAAEIAISLAPNSILAHEAYGMIYRDIGLYSPDGLNLAAEAFKKAISLEPSNPVLITELGKIYKQKGMTEKAKEYFELALEVKNNHTDARLGLAGIYMGKNENDQAIELLIGEAGKNIDVYNELGKAYFNSGNYSMASENFRQVVSISPLHANGLFSLGLSLEKEGKIDEALSYFKKVQELNPENADLQAKIKKIEDDKKIST
jgi:tetratricopeptide (TPR) repeat protein